MVKQTSRGIVSRTQRRFPNIVIMLGVLGPKISLGNYRRAEVVDVDGCEKKNRNSASCENEGKSSKVEIRGKIVFS